MFKHIILILVIALTALIVLFPTQSTEAVQYLLSAQNWISQMLSDVFTAGQAGNIARGMIALLTIPVIVGLIPALFYWILRKHWFPYFMQVVWVVWLVQAGALLMAAKAAVGG